MVWWRSRWRERKSEEIFSNVSEDFMVTKTNLSNLIFFFKPMLKYKK